MGKEKKNGVSLDFSFIQRIYLEVNVVVIQMETEFTAWLVKCTNKVNNCRHVHRVLNITFGIINAATTCFAISN